MRPTGAVRPLDAFGRIQLPRTLRDELHLTEKQAMEFMMEDNMICLCKAQPMCVFCRGKVDLFAFKEKNVCMTCKENIRQMLEG